MGAGVLDAFTPIVGAMVTLGEGVGKVARLADDTPQAMTNIIVNITIGIVNFFILPRWCK
jgi:hypothetical protein